MGRKRTLNRMDYRSEDYDEFGEDESTPDDDDDEELSDDDDGADEEEDEEPAPKPKKKKATRTRRTRATKSPRMKVVWGVFDNSNKRVATFEYSQEADARTHAVELQEKKGEIYFVQPVKEAMETE